MRAPRGPACSRKSAGFVTQISHQTLTLSAEGLVCRRGGRLIFEGVGFRLGNGEVLAFVSKPTYDVNLFVGGIDQENWDALHKFGTQVSGNSINRIT